MGISLPAVGPKQTDDMANDFICFIVSMQAPETPSGLAATSHSTDCSAQLDCKLLYQSEHQQDKVASGPKPPIIVDEIIPFSGLVQQYLAMSVVAWKHNSRLGVGRGGHRDRGEGRIVHSKFSSLCSFVSVSSAQIKIMTRLQARLHERRAMRHEAAYQRREADSQTEHAPYNDGPTFLQPGRCHLHRFCDGS